MKSRRDFSSASEYTDYLTVYYSGIALGAMLQNAAIVKEIASDELAAYAVKHAENVVSNLNIFTS